MATDRSRHRRAWTRPSLHGPFTLAPRLQIRTRSRRWKHRQSRRRRRQEGKATTDAPAGHRNRIRVATTRFGSRAYRPLSSHGRLLIHLPPRNTKKHRKTHKYSDPLRPTPSPTLTACLIPATTLPRAGSQYSLAAYVSPSVFSRTIAKTNLRQSRVDCLLHGAKSLNDAFTR
jgi:hypothetical protein